MHCAHRVHWTFLVGTAKVQMQTKVAMQAGHARSAIFFPEGEQLEMKGTEPIDFHTGRRGNTFAEPGRTSPPFGDV